MTRKALREPKTIDEARTFLEGMVRRNESFHLSTTLGVSLYHGHISRSEQFDLHWYGVNNSQHAFHSHSIALLLREFIAWRSLSEKPVPPAKAHLTARPIRRIMHEEPVSLWGNDPT